MAHTVSQEDSADASGWDPLVRLTHWGIAAAVLLNGLITEGGSQIHVWVGYAAFTLLALRLVWALIGPWEARFTAFPPSPSAAVGHVRDIVAGRHGTHRSHNPLGALMVYALWANLAVVTITGISMAGSPLAPAPAEAKTVVVASAEETGEADDDGERGGAHDGEREAGEALEEIHGAAANLLLVLAALHIGGVAFESWRTGPGLMRAMTTGGSKTGRQT